MLAALSLASGFSGLVYEVLWAKDLGLLFGSTAAAQMVVLASFLGGLAAGNWALGRRADLVDPLGLYGRLEFGIAGLGIAAPLLFRAALWAFPARYPIGAAAVLLPTFLMGGTIPALARAAAPCGGEGVERAVAGIYFWNCLGAVAGALAAGYVLIARFGLDGTAAAAACVNAGCGAVALKRSAIMMVDAPKEKKKSDDASVRLPELLVYEAAFLSGLASLVYETGWVRLLTLVMGGSSYSFCAMLAGFIGGIALGSLLLSRTRLGSAQPAVLFGWAQIGIAVAVLLSMPLYERLPYWFRLINGVIPRRGWGFAEYEAVKFLFCFALMVPATSLIGLTLPLMSRLAAASQDVGRSVGRVFAANTAGNVLGAAAAYWALPALGLESMLRSATTVNAVIGLGVLYFALSWPRARRWALAALVFGSLGGYRLVVPRWNRMMLSLGDFRGLTRTRPPSYAAYRAQVPKVMRMPFIEDDPESTISIMNNQEGLTALKINGNTQASNRGDMGTQILCAELPMILRPEIRDALVIGLGSGITAGSVLRHRALRRLDIVEISPGVARAAAYFHQDNSPLFHDPRARLLIADAKAFLRSPGGPDYDFVMSEPSNPWMAGVANLFTTDFYADVRRRLKPGGMMLQWFHLYEMDDADFRLVLRTFSAAFRHVGVWNIHDADVLMLGSDTELAPDWNAAEAEILDPPVQSDIDRAGLHTVAALLSMQAAGDATARRMAGDGPLNTDRRPILEYTAPKAFFRGDYSELIDREDDRNGPESRKNLLFTAYRASRRPLRPIEYMDIVMVRHSKAERAEVRYFIDEWARVYPGDASAALAQFLFYREMNDRAKSLAGLNRLKRLEPRRPDLKKLEAELPKGT